jgi:hypothetical protein
LATSRWLSEALVRYKAANFWDTANSCEKSMKIFQSNTIQFLFNSSFNTVAFFAALGFHLKCFHKLLNVCCQLLNLLSLDIDLVFQFLPENTT